MAQLKVFCLHPNTELDFFLSAFDFANYQIAFAAVNDFKLIEMEKCLKEI